MFQSGIPSNLQNDTLATIYGSLLLFAGMEKSHSAAMCLNLGRKSLESIDKFLSQKSGKVQGSQKSVKNTKGKYTVVPVKLVHHGKHIRVSSNVETPKP